MAITLYDSTVGSFLQTLGAVDGFLAKGLAHCKEKNIDPNEIVETRLFPDMLPFRFQVVAVAHHSAGALAGAKAGAFAPPGPSTADYAGLQKLVSDARQALEQVKPDEVNALEGKDVHLLGARHEDAVQGRRLPDDLLDAELPFPRHDRVRHPALERRAARQARLHGPDEAGEVGTF